MDDHTAGRYAQCYQPLAPLCIRVFELEAGEFSDPIVGRLVVQPQNDVEPYEAISYVWGDTRNRRDITVDGVTLSITLNLYGALTAFRRRPTWTTGGDSDTASAQRQPVRRLWADAICVNQEDLQERVSQVELMASIFAGASRVLSWLGWEEGLEGRRHTQDAIRFIHSFMDDPEAGLRDARILLRHHDDLVDSERRHSHFSEDELQQFEEEKRKWEAIKFFFDIEYFHRAWIVQELGLAREAILFTALRPTGDSDQASREDHASEGVVVAKKDSDLEVDTIEWPLVGKFVEFMDYNGASLVTHLSILLWVAHHILMVWQTKEDGSPECDFLTGMHWTRILRVTDPRDRVFSLLGHPLAVMDGELIVHPDYRPTRGVIYTKLAVNFIRKTKNLNVVSFVDHEVDPASELRVWDPMDDARMSSWVPDWHSINRTTPVDYPIDAAAIQDFSINIEGEVNGVHGTPLPHLLVHGWVIDEVVAISKRMETKDFPVTHLAREWTKDNPFWLDRIWELVDPARNQSDDSAVGANDALAVLEYLSVALPLGTREKGAPVSKAGLNQPLDEHQCSFAAYVVEYHNLLRSALSETVIDPESNIKRPLPAVSILDSLPADAQAELRRRAEGVTGGKFLECMTWPSMCRIVYRTKTGLVGMGSRVTRPGDLICRISGSPVLMTLRKIEDIGDNNNSVGDPILCTHIGPTIVPARMKRGIIDGSVFGEKPANFRIV